MPQKDADIELIIEVTDISKEKIKNNNKQFVKIDINCFYYDR